jgi:hypothetical protein
VYTGSIPVGASSPLRVSARPLLERGDLIELRLGVRTTPEHVPRLAEAWGKLGIDQLGELRLEARKAERSQRSTRRVGGGSSLHVASNRSANARTSSAMGRRYATTVTLDPCPI